MIALLIFIIGLCFGSFITMASHRLPRDMEWMRSASHCPKCNHSLGVKDLFPVISWLKTGGKCGYCQSKISIRYPLIEILTGLIFVLLFWQFGLTPLMGVMALFSVVLLIMLVADFETGLIPDEIHFALLPLGIAFHYLLGSDWGDIFVTSAVGLGLGLLLHYGYFWLRGKHGLGLGDVKFLAVAGLWLGTLHHLVVFIFYSGLLGVVMGVLWRILIKQERFPFGPALAVSLFLLIVFPETGKWFWEGIAATLELI